MPKICEDCGATARKKVQVNDKTTLYCNDCFEKSHEKVDDIELKTMQSVDKPNEKSSDKKVFYFVVLIFEMKLFVVFVFVENEFFLRFFFLHILFKKGRWCLKNDCTFNEIK